MATCDWQPFLSHFILNNKSNLNILEFGLGLGTEIFLDKGHNVHSLEILRVGADTTWFENMKVKYAGRNWKGTHLPLTPYLDSIETLERSKYDYKPEKSKEIVDSFRTMLKPYLTERKYDLIFVDPGVHLRGELVNLAFETNVDFVAAHDTNVPPKDYGWDCISPPPHYKKIHYNVGLGTTLFVNTLNRFLDI